MVHRFTALCCLLLATLPLLPARAGNDPAPAGARAVGLGNAAATLTDAWAVTNNVGGLGWLERPSVGVFAESRFGVTAFRTTGLAAALPVKGGVLGVGGLDVARFGDDLYSETRGGLGYAYKQGPFSLGVKVDYQQRSIQGLASRRAVAVSLGGVVRLLPKLWLGAYGYNLNQAKLVRETNERLPTLLKAGLSYRPAEKVLLNVEAQKQIDQKVAVVGGIEYLPIQAIALRTGFNSLTQGFAFGVGGRAKRLQLDYALLTHPVLGITHHVSLGFVLGQEPAPASSTTPGQPQ